MSLRSFALLFGIPFLLIGIAGFVPGLATAPHPEHPRLLLDMNYGQLFGLFPVNMLHNAVHIAFGIWGLLVFRNQRGARLYARGTALIYGALTTAGFVPGLDTMFGMMPLFGNDVWLDALIALVAAYYGWAHREPAPAPEPPSA